MSHALLPYRKHYVPQAGLIRRGGDVYSNWNGVVVFTSKDFVAPNDIGELQDVIKRSARLRIVGSCHSMNGAVATDADGILVQMNNLKQIEKPTEDPSGEFGVWMEAGATLGEAAAALSREGFAFPCLPQSPKITLGGMIANGVHGSSLRESAVLAEHVMGMELISSSGQLVAVPSELLPLARVSLGSLGAIARIKVRVVPNFYLISSGEKLSADVALETQTLIQDLNAHDFQLSYTYDPIARTVTRRTLDRVESSQAGRFADLPRKTQYDQTRLDFLTDWALACGARLPNGLFGLRDKVKRHICEGVLPIESRIGESRFMFQTDLTRPVHDMACAVPIGRCQEILESVAREFERIGYQPDLPLGLRFLKGTDKVALAMNTGQDVAVIECTSLIEFHDNAEAFTSFERVLHDAGGRPHWAKEFYFNPKSAYPEDVWNAFSNLSAQWGWKFTNAWSRRFSPAGAATSAGTRN